MTKQLYVSCGFRCFTHGRIKKIFGIDVARLPFDAGFFTPRSMVKFLQTDNIDINMSNTTPCLKTEEVKEHGKKILVWERSDYKTIDEYIDENGFDNRYLDHSRAYYTLCEDYGFLIAHYNWHSLSDPERNKGVTSPIKNIPRINNTLNRRKVRLIEQINDADVINLCFYECQNYEFMKIDNMYYNILKDSEMMLFYLRNRFPGKNINQIFL